MHVMHDADEEVSVAERRLARAGPRDFPRHAGQRGGEVVFVLRGSRQLNAQRALGLRLPQRREDFRPQHLLRNADSNLRNRRCFLALLDVEAEVVAEIEEPLLMADSDRIEIGMAKGELRAVRIEQVELGCAVRVVSGDDEVKMSRHSDWYLFTSVGQDCPEDQADCISKGDGREVRIIPWSLLVGPPLTRNESKEPSAAPLGARSKSRLARMIVGS